MIDFLIRAIDEDSLHAMAFEHGFMKVDGGPVPGTDWDIAIPVQPPEGLIGEWVPSVHANLRLSGALEQEQIEGIEQYNKGELLPLRQRTKWGLEMTQLGSPWTGENDRTTGAAYQGVTFIDPESVASQQRVWQ